MTQGLFDAFYLPPTLAARAETSVQRFGPAHDAVELRLVSVTPAAIDEWIDGLRAARAALITRPAAEIHRALEHVAVRFLDPTDAARKNAVAWLGRMGRFPAAMIQQALDDTFEPLVVGGVSRWVASELGSAAVLDAPQPDRRGLARRAFGPEWMLQIYAGNVPGLSVWPLYSALAMKSALLAKASSQEPVLAPLLARTIAEEDATLGDCIAVVWWKGGTMELDRAAIHQAPAVLAFGGEHAIASIAREAHPEARLVLQGPKVSVAYVSGASLTRAALGPLASRAAYDVSLYDQQGCLSPHAIYVERGGAVGPAAFASALGQALDALRDGLPRGPIEAEHAARVQLYRAQAAFEEAQESRGTRVLTSGEGTDWTVVYEEGARFEPTPAYRTVRVHSVANPQEVVDAVAPHAGWIEAVALEAKGKERGTLAAAFAGTGIPRVTAIGALQRPELTGTHGGVHRLLPFVRWSTVEVGLGAKKKRPPGKTRRPSSKSKKGRR